MFELSTDQASAFIDPSFPTALRLASAMGAAVEPAWLEDPKECIRLVELVQTNVVPKFVQGTAPGLYETTFDSAFADWATNASSAPGVDSTPGRKNVLLRLWAGCVWSGKFVALETRGGTTTPAQRTWFFVGIVAPRLGLCPVYRAGVHYAVDWKRSFNPPQVVSFEGVPSDHLVRARYDAGVAR